MEESKISSKGQMVIPKYLRDALGFEAGTVVVITLSENKLVIMKKPADPLASLAEQKNTMRNIRREIKEE